MVALVRKAYTLLFRLIPDFVLSFGGTKRARFLTAEETIRQCIEQGKSLIRFGDGEFNMMRGLDVHYQRSHPELISLLRLIVERYVDSPDECPYILCMPGDFLRCSGFRLLKRKAYFVSWPPSRKYFNAHFDIPVTYGDAFVFAAEYQRVYRTIWTQPSVSHIIFVNSSEAAFLEFRTTVLCRVSFVPVPSENAFARMHEIIRDIRSNIDYRVKNATLVLISAGPCGKALAFLLSTEGVRAIDTGHCFRNPLHRIE